MRIVLRAWMSAMLVIALAGCSDSSGPGSSTDRFRQVSVGESRVCAVVESGAGYCWGKRPRVEPAFDLRPVRFGGSRTFRQLSSAHGIFGGYVCGLTSSATVCDGYLLANGDGAGPISSTAAELASDVPLATIATASTHFCGLDESGAAWCWGAFDGSVRGTGQPEPSHYSLEPNAVADGLAFATIGAGVLHSCGATPDGAVYCWGYGPYLGAPSAELDSLADNCSLTPPCAHAPVRAELAAPAAALSVGSNTTCAILPVAQVWCWGYGFDGAAPALAPRRIEVPGSAASAALGEEHGCILTTEGRAYCLGFNAYGQLGTGAASPEFQPTPVPSAGDLRFTSLSAGGNTTCGLTGEGLLYCWGNNEEGELATGNRESSAVPVRVTLPQG